MSSAADLLNVGKSKPFTWPAFNYSVICENPFVSKKSNRFSRKLKETYLTKSVPASIPIESKADDWMQF